MNTKVIITKRIETIEGKRALTWEEDEKGMKHFDCNLPYKKSLEDWKFYANSIRRALKEFRK